MVLIYLCLHNIFNVVREVTTMTQDENVCFGRNWCVAERKREMTLSFDDISSRDTRGVAIWIQQNKKGKMTLHWHV